MTFKSSRLSFSQKLMLGISISIFVVFGIGGAIANWLIQEQLHQQAFKQMEVTSQGIHGMVHSLVISSIKNYLKGISETNYAYVENVYARYKAGEISEHQAKAQAESFMLKQKIGSSGYVTAVDVSNGGNKFAVHPFFKGKDLSADPFDRPHAGKKTGYLEFEWKNPTDQKTRMKSRWMSYFEPWQWIISAAPFRDEYPQLVDLAGIETELSKVGMQGNGYAFIMDMQGSLLSHPTWKGRNMINEVDANTGVPFVRNMIDSIQQSLKQDQKTESGGIVQYQIKDPESGHIYLRAMNFRYVSETGWIVGVVTDLDQLEAPLIVVKNIQIIVMIASLIFALLVVVWAVRPMTRSIEQLAAAVEKIDGGHFETHLPHSGFDEIGRLSASVGRMAERLSRYTDDLELQVADRTEALKDANDRLTLLSTTDALTGLPNRRRFDEELASEWSRATRIGEPLSLAMLDIDWFKKYNDHYGHQAGDKCLRDVAQVLSKTICRAGDLVARYGGEEFVFILPATTGENALKVAKKICDELQSQGFPHEKSSFGCVTFSIGVATLIPNEEQKPEVLVKAADEALYRAKELGRNGAVLA